LGLGVFTATSLACALATTDSFLIAMRGLQGLGAAIVLPAALSIVMNMFDEGGERNKALGIWGGIGAGGATVGLIAGGVLTRYLGWQYIFFLNVPIGALALLLAPRLVPESRLATARRRYDPFGAITSTAGLLLLVYAVTKAPQDGWASLRTISFLAVAGALIGAFLTIETRVEAPLLPLRIFRLRTLAGATAAGLLLGGSFFAFIFVGTAFAFIPISIAGLAGVAEHEAGLASGLLNTTQQIGGAIGVAIASTVAAGHFKTLTAAGSAAPAALTGGFQWALWVCGAIGLA